MAESHPVRCTWAALLLAVLLLLVGCGGAASDQEQRQAAAEVAVLDDDGLHGAVLTEPYLLPEATLTDSTGDPVAVRRSLRAPVTLVFFGYTRCPDICQVVMANVSSALSRLDPEQADQVAMWFLTTDPARDDPAVLRRYLDRFDPGFEGFTGPLREILRVADGMHIAVERGRKLPTGGYEVTHGTPVLGVLPDGSVPLVWTEGTSAAELAADLDTVLSDGVPAVQAG